MASSTFLRGTFLAKYVLPSVEKTAFNCPHCGVLTSQFWSRTLKGVVKTESKCPNIWSSYNDKMFSHLEDSSDREKILAFIRRAASGKPFFEKLEEYSGSEVINLHLSSCMECNEISVWLHGNLVWPATAEIPEANPDLPADALADYAEAGLVLNVSPRSAAALLRQSVQRLCKHLGGAGKNIDADIAALVQRGLDIRVQKALDVVRVIGNNAVHPGQIDLKDDRPTAEKLFSLVNLIADVMISQPKHIGEMFDALPQNALEAIEKRDAPKQIEHRKP